MSNKRKIKTLTAPTTVPDGMFAIYGRVADLIAVGLFQQGLTLSNGDTAYVVFKMPDGIGTDDLVDHHLGFLVLKPGADLPAAVPYRYRGES